MAAVTVTVALGVHLAGLDGVPENRVPDAFSVLLTVAATAPLAVRNRYPLAVLTACLAGALGLVALRYAAGAAPVGTIVAFYTVAAVGSRRTGRHGVVVLLVGLVLLAVLRPIDLSAEGAVVNCALLVGGWVLGTGTRERRALHEAQVLEAERRVELERERASRAAVEERLRLTRELHDVLGHAMSVMVVQAGVAEHLLDAQPSQAREAIARVGRTGRSSLQEMRQLLRTTRDTADASGLSPQPGLADLPALVARVETAGLPVELRSAGDPGDASPGIELAVYRLVQEALTNTLKHAGPARARVHLSHPAGAVEIEVVDDGRGRSPDEVRGAEGHGLIGMRERVAVYAGQLITGNAPDGGFRVWARFPLPGGTPGRNAAGTS
ncbi:sensor histidine kinase [Actinoplanes sp. M2I2]|uniref:sensor histidine kinase n=1 Tax=Actinoplanes sp. M2I2 TaxID=1734444 RepID=UPI00201FD224|nr:sensor histidine kinase [Actinoplanes sp. M2I2]